MTKRKIFYSMIQENDIVGLKKQDGYEIDINGTKFNAYINEINNSAYILDPKNGTAVFTYRYSLSTLSPYEHIQQAKNEFIRQGAFEKWKELCNRENYQLAKKMFKAYKKAEQQRELLHKESRFFL
jgi:hypothetical protein